MKRKISCGLLLSLILFLNSCSNHVPARHRRNLPYCYNGKNTGIDTIININGYYEIHENSGATYEYGYGKWATTVVDTFPTKFMFFKDGTFLHGFSDYNHRPGNIPKYFEEVVSNTQKGERDPFFQHASWGCYIISGNIIKTQYVTRPSGIGSGYWDLTEEWFKVIDKNTLKSIFRKNVTNSDSKIIYDNKTTENTQYTRGHETITLDSAKFIPTPLVPGSDCWLKYKKWFWCDRDKYEEWKKKIEKK